MKNTLKEIREEMLRQYEEALRQYEKALRQIERERLVDFRQAFNDPNRFPSLPSPTRKQTITGGFTGISPRAPNQGF